MKNIVIIIVYFIAVLTACGCKKFVEIGGPATSVSSKDIYTTDATALGVLTGLYANLSSGSMTGTSEFLSLSCIAGLSADELSLFSNANSPVLRSYYSNNLTNVISSYWNPAYARIYTVNSALEGIASSITLTPLLKKQLLGEARFMRAFYYFYLLNLFGEVPIVTGTDYNTNRLLGKSSKEALFSQIEVDLKEAQSLLNDNYLKGDGLTFYQNGTEERIRPTKWAATGLLARVYLYKSDWPNAEAQANLVIQNTAQYTLESIDKVFLKNNKEAIFQLQSIRGGNNTMDANTFLLPPTGPSVSYPVYLSNDLVNSFEQEDLRKKNWIRSVTANSISYFYPFKYKVPQTNIPNSPVTEYSTVMRLAEQFLIRSEARANQGKLDGAIDDIDEIRKRAGLNLIKNISPGITKEDLLLEISKENRLEFFTEWGHRWFDLKRTGKVEEVMKVITPIKGNTLGWKNYQQYYPIPLNELNSAPNLTPTPGY